MIIERINTYLLNSDIGKASGSAETNPFNTEGKRFLNMEPWVGYTFGSIFILIGIACFFLYPRAKRRAEEYKKEQLEEYNKIKKFKTNDYSKTGMFLPAWERMKLFAPLFFGVLFVIIGIAWLAGNTLTTL